MNRPRFLSLIVFCLVAGSTGALPAFASDASDQKAVLQAEDARIDALRHDDYATLDRFLTEDLTYTHSTSAVDSKASFLDLLKSGRVKYHNMVHENPLVRIYGSAALITTTTIVDVTVAGKRDQMKLRVMLVYVKKPGAWRMAAWQSTRINP